MTVLALILQTSGELPSSPEAFWDSTTIDESFAALIKSESELRRECLRGLRSVISYRDTWQRKSLPYNEADELLHSSLPPFPFRSVSALEAHVRRGASRLRYATPAIRDDIKLDFAHAMALTRCRLDGKRRSALLGGEGRTSPGRTGPEADGRHINSRTGRSPRTLARPDRKACRPTKAGAVLR